MIFLRNIFTKHHVAFSSSVLILLVNSEHRETFLSWNITFFTFFLVLVKPTTAQKYPLGFTIVRSDWKSLRNLQGQYYVFSAILTQQDSSPLGIIERFMDDSKTNGVKNGKDDENRFAIICTFFTCIKEFEHSNGNFHGPLQQYGRGAYEQEE